jgi:hypothetical protein
MNQENVTPSSGRPSVVPYKEQHHDSLKINLTSAECGRAPAERDVAVAESLFSERFYFCGKGKGLFRG